MTFSYQNLQEGELTPRYWRYGLCWLRRAGEWYRLRAGVLRVEWTLPAGHCGWGMTLGDGDGGRDLGFTFAIPFLATLYVTIENLFARTLFTYDFDRGHDRQIGCYFHEWTFRWSIWVGTMASWSRTYPWCRWWRQGSIDFKRLALGKMTYAKDVLQANIPLLIPMPEGVYQAVGELQSCTWKRTRWIPMRRIYVEVTIPKGIPFQGKGENSWDCGDDGLFGYSSEGASLETAIAKGVESVLSSRRRYGHPSDQAITEALSR